MAYFILLVSFSQMVRQPKITTDLLKTELLKI